MTARRRIAATSVPGVFAVGDVRSGSVKRVGGAIGEGAAVVAQIHGFLDNMKAAARPNTLSAAREQRRVRSRGGVQRARLRPPQWLQLTLARLRRSVASGRRVRRS